MARTISPRAHERQYVLKVLRACRTNLAWLHSHWSVTGTVYDFDSRDDRGNVPTRPRAGAEYPENQRAEWAALSADLDDAIGGLTILREHARRMVDDLS